MNPFDPLAFTKHEPLAPAIQRGSMVPRAWTPFFTGLVLLLRSAWASPEGRPATTPEPWEKAARSRRTLLMGLVALTSLATSWLLISSESEWHHPMLQGLQIGLFTLLSGWVAAGFFTALMGFMTLLKSDPMALALPSGGTLPPMDPTARTAVIMPICNENVHTVFAGLRAIAESIAESDAASLCHVFVLSDTSDPTLRAHELAALGSLRETLGDRCPVYYRWRERRTRRKAGNVADFCRRWGKSYRYMVVLDADSVMSGKSIATLIHLMEKNPKAGIIQTAPQSCGMNTWHARAQQFSGRVAGRLFTEGMQYWQLGESHYWGHNAIIRVEPFMRHCALSILPGKGGLSGEILSHDFVEAALMRRAGYHIWLVPSLEGSYEQPPSNLMEELQRDRRWCQGNLKNLRLMAEPGLHPAHRVMLFTGGMAYLSAPLWLAFLLISLSLRWLEPTVSAASGAWTAFPSMPVALPMLWSTTLALLFVPRALAAYAVFAQKRQAAFGGSAVFLKSLLLESVLSLLQAPIRMMAHTLFVIVALTGLKLEWKSPQREATTLEWGELLQRLAPLVSPIVALVVVTFFLRPEAGWWLLPVGLPLLLSTPLGVLTSRVSSVRPGALLSLPEERRPAAVLRKAWGYAGNPLTAGWFSKPVSSRKKSERLRVLSGAS